MEKIRIHELAKQLNTNSKRLMEKLEEINIHPKGPMSYLENDELIALKKHLGMNVSDEAKTDKDKEQETKKQVVSRQITASPKANPIIKRVINVVESDNPVKPGKDKSNIRPSRAPMSDLRAGFVVRDDKYDSFAAQRPDRKKKETVKKDAVQNDTANKQILKEEVNAEKSENAEKQVPKDESAKKTAGKKIKSEEIKAEETAVKTNAEAEDVSLIKESETVSSDSPVESVQSADTVNSGKMHDKSNIVKSDEKISDADTQTDANDSEKNLKVTNETVKKDVKEQAYEKKPSEHKITDEGNKPARNKEQRATNNNFQRDRKPAANQFQGKGPKAKEDIPLAETDEIISKSIETKREAQNREQDKNFKRENKKELTPNKSFPSANKDKRYKPDKLIIGEKKGVKEVLSDDFVLENIEPEQKNPRRFNKPRKDNRRMQPVHQEPVKAVLTNITIGESLTVKELAEALKKTSAEVIKKLLMMGVMATLNQEIDFDTAALIADEFGITAEKAVVVNVEDLLFEEDDENDENAVTRPPVVVVMGHVDHGKTSLLDAIRSTSVTEVEAGGITQHIGAYTVNINNRKITFLDTPGHEAFTAMRARGAQVTDIAILVVAADDGVMPQTIEAINHAKAANVSIIVAVNKIDKPGANPDKVKQELTEYGLVAEEWGGDVIFVPVSAKKRENIDTLLEMVLLSADMLELKSNPDKQARGTIIEAKLDRTKGAVATVLVQRGTLKLGDSIVTGTTVGRIRAMTDDKGKAVTEAGPSTPVEILGMPDVPEAGEIFYAIKDEKLAKQLAEKRKNKIREEQLKDKNKVSLEDLFNRIQDGKMKELNLIVKADVQGSVEAVKQSLEKLSNEEVRVKIIHGGVGAITESDIQLASVSDAIIIGFNVRPGINISAAAEEAGVDIRLYNVIYNAIEDIEAALKGMLEPTYKEVIQGHAVIRQIYKVSGVGSIAGCYVTDGKITRNSDVRVIRDSIVVYSGKLASLKRFKDDVKEVNTNFECGLSIEKFNDIKENDIIEAYAMEEVEK